MKKLIGATLLASLAFACDSKKFSDPQIDPQTVIQAVGSPGEFDAAASTLRFTHVRPSIDLRVQGQQVPADLALRAWITISGTRAKTTLLGNIPLLSSEIDSFLRIAVQSGVVVTALHETLLDESPRLVSAHIEMLGAETVVSRAASQIWKAVTENRLPPNNTLQKITAVTPSRMDQEKMEARLWKGRLENGVFRVSLGRATLLHGKSVGKAAGVSSWAVFAGQESHAVVNADIATLESELPHLLGTLLESNLKVISIHTHLTNEKPRLLFVHVFGAGTAESLAKAIREAIELKEEFQSQ